MINTIEALQGLYIALGGDISDVENVTTIPEMLTLISTVAEAAASELPVVNATDNGNVLTVVNGKWGKANVPTELPAVTGDDIGKVLGVVSDGESGAEYALELPENELPTPAVGDIGKVVSVVSDGDEGAEYSLETPSGGGLPEIENKDKGSVLTVNEDKSLAWEAKQTIAVDVMNTSGTWNINTVLTRTKITSVVQTNPSGLTASVTYSETSGNYDTYGGIIPSLNSTYDGGAIFSGILKAYGKNIYKQIIVYVGAAAENDYVILNPITTT